MYVQQRFSSCSATKLRCKLQQFVAHTLLHRNAVRAFARNVRLAFRTPAVLQLCAFWLMYFNTTYAEHRMFIELIMN